MSINRYFPFAFIYFFLNSLGLPFGLTYTTVLAPLFYVWLLLVRKQELVIPFVSILAPFIIIHFTLTGVDTESYFISLTNMIGVYIFCQAVYTFLLAGPDLESIFRRILIINFILCLLAVPLYFTAYSQPVWGETNIAMNVGQFRRLQLFTYEPSYYAMLFSPVFMYYLLQYALGINRIAGKLLLPMLLLPYVLSFSIGVIGAMLAAGLLLGLFHFRRLFSKKRVLYGMILLLALCGTSLILLMIFARNNAVFTRIMNIISGEDSSGNGRVRDAFILARQLLSQKGMFWGIGPGQIKILGQTTIRNYYLYYSDVRVAIPNAAAETLAVFGWIGFSARMSIEVFFFYYTRTWSNYFRFLLFLFVFIYQFTGSYITNVAEYVIWIFAFTKTFPQFDIKQERG